MFWNMKIIATWLLIAFSTLDFFGWALTELSMILVSCLEIIDIILINYTLCNKQVRTPSRCSWESCLSGGSCYNQERFLRPHRPCCPWRSKGKDLVDHMKRADLNTQGPRTMKIEDKCITSSIMLKCFEIPLWANFTFKLVSPSKFFVST